MSLRTLPDYAHPPAVETVFGFRQSRAGTFFIMA
jgi:hypothetical protein